MKIHEYNEMMKWLTRPAPDPIINRPSFKPGGLVEPGVMHYATKTRGAFKEEVIQIYNAIKESGKKVFTRDIAERVTKSKMTGDALKSQIAEYLKRENLPYEKSDLGRAEEARTKAAKTIKKIKRVENFLPNIKKDELFADIRKYRSGPITGPDATMKIKEFAKYFPEGTSDVVISRQINRVANDVLKLPDHPVKGKAGELEAKRVKEKIKKVGDPEGVAKKMKGTVDKPLHHMRAKGFMIDNKIKAISPSLADLTYLDVKTNSELFQNVERLRNEIVKEQMELVERKPEGWQRRLKELNAKSRHLANKMPKNLKGLMYWEQMDEAGNLKAIGGNPMKSIGKLMPEGKIKFDSKDVKIIKDQLNKGVLNFAKKIEGTPVAKQLDLKLAKTNPAKFMSRAIALGLGGELAAELAFAMPGYAAGKSIPLLLGESIFGIFGAGRTFNEELAKYADPKAKKIIDLQEDIKQVEKQASVIGASEAGLEGETELQKRMMPGYLKGAESAFERLPIFKDPVYTAAYEKTLAKLQKDEEERAKSLPRKAVSKVVEAIKTPFIEGIKDVGQSPGLFKSGGKVDYDNYLPDIDKIDDDK